MDGMVGQKMGTKDGVTSAAISACFQKGSRLRCDIHMFFGSYEETFIL